MALLTTPGTYRSVLRALKTWPANLEKSQRMRECLGAHVKSSFREVGEIGDVQKRLKMAEEQAVSIRRMAKNELLATYGPGKDSLMLGFLPPKRVFALLEKKTIDELKEKKNMSFMNMYFPKREQSE